MSRLKVATPSSESVSKSSTPIVHSPLSSTLSSHDQRVPNVFERISRTLS